MEDGNYGRLKKKSQRLGRSTSNCINSSHDDERERSMMNQVSSPTVASKSSFISVM